MEVRLDRTINFIFTARINKKRNKNYFTIIIKFFMSLWLGTIFSYYALIPAALNFFLSYSDEVIEPLWSFDQYFEFILVLIL